MAAELIAFGVGANWVTKLYKKLKGIRKEKQEELNKINDDLNVNPLELSKYYVEPECQEFNPANRGSSENRYRGVSFGRASRRKTDARPAGNFVR